MHEQRLPQKHVFTSTDGSYQVERGEAECTYANNLYHWFEKLVSEVCGGRSCTLSIQLSVLSCVGCVGCVGWKSCVGHGSWDVGNFAWVVGKFKWVVGPFYR